MDFDELLGSIPPEAWRSRLRRQIRRLSPADLRRQIRWGIQRWRRGYSDRDVWSLDHYLATVIPPAMRQLRDEAHGVPSTIAAKYDSVDEAAVEWAEILEKVAAGFEAWTLMFDESPRSESPRMQELQARFDEGGRLFLEHFGSFWD